MGTEYGLDWRVQVGDGADPEVFTEIGGEIQFTWSRSSDEIDESTKDDGAYGSTSYGQQKIKIAMSGNLKLPNAGIKRVSDVSKLRPPHLQVKIMKGAIVKFDGLMAVGNFSIEAPLKGPATYNYDLSNVGAPDTDDLTATV